MVIYDFNIDRSRASLRPLKAYPPPIIDANAVLALSLTLERFEPVPRQTQVQKGGRRVQLVKLQFRPVLKSSEGFDSFPFGKFFRSLVSEAHDHGSYYPTLSFTSSVTVHFYSKWIRIVRLLSRKPVFCQEPLSPIEIADILL
jgi:hypothetical protein